VQRIAVSIARRGQAPSKRTTPQGETKKRRGHHAARPNGHHSARPSGALIETRTRTPTQRRHRVACPRGAMIRSYTPLSDQHPTGTSPDVMASSLGSHAGYDYRSTGASPIETNTASRESKTLVWGHDTRLGTQHIAPEFRSTRIEPPLDGNFLSARPV
jgi:hypothetical protein